MHQGVSGDPLTKMTEGDRCVTPCSQSRTNPYPADIDLGLLCGHRDHAPTFDCERSNAPRRTARVTQAKWWRHSGFTDVPSSAASARVSDPPGGACERPSTRTGLDIDIDCHRLRGRSALHGQSARHGGGQPDCARAREFSGYRTTALVDMRKSPRYPSCGAPEALQYVGWEPM